MNNPLNCSKCGHHIHEEGFCKWHDCRCYPSPAPERMSEEEFDEMALNFADVKWRGFDRFIAEARRAQEAEAELQMALDTLRGSIQSDCDDLAAKDAEIAALKKALGPTRGNRAAWQFRADKAEAERDALQKAYDSVKSGHGWCRCHDALDRLIELHGVKIREAESRAERLAAALERYMALHEVNRQRIMYFGPHEFLSDPVLEKEAAALTEEK